MRNLIAIACVALLAACSNNPGGTTASSTASTSTASQASPMAVASGGDLYYGAHLPAGPQLTDLKTTCEICHSGDMYATQRLSKPIWDAEVTKMMKFGSPLPKADKASVVAYLAKYLGTTVPRPDAVPTATAPPITYGSPPTKQ